MDTTLVTCVICPKGCSISVEWAEKDGKKEIISVNGNSCKRGFEYASSEVIHPERVLTSTIRIKGGNMALLPIRSASPLPKELLLSAMKEISKKSVTAPIRMGDVIIPNICDSGIDMIACRDSL